MKEIKKSIVNETVGTLAAELEAQELGDVNGGATPAIVSAVTAVVALACNVNVCPNTLIVYSVGAVNPEDCLSWNVT